MNDGGPAFPTVFTGPHDAPQESYGMGGMSLRDWFAGQALAGMCANYKLLQNIKAEYIEPESVLADYAFKAADAMIEVREEDQ